MRLSDLTAAGSTTANSQIFHQAALGFAILFFGIRHQQAHITKQGFAIHGIALKQLNSALQSSNRYVSDDIILSVATLAILECWVPTGTNHYLIHMTGLERLLELRGPSSFSSPKRVLLYKAVRRMILLASLRTGKRSILARSDWKTAFRENCSNDELQEQDLFDVLADCTVLAAEHDSMLATREPDLEFGSLNQVETHRKALTLLNQLFAWKERWDGDINNAYIEGAPVFPRTESVEELLSDDLTSFHTTFKFCNDAAAIMLMFYNTTLIYVFRVLASHALDSPSSHSSQSFTQDAPLDADCAHALREQTKRKYNAEERLAALEVCRCLPYHMNQLLDLNAITSPVVQWAVATAWLTLGGSESAEGRWMAMLLLTRNREVVAKGLLTT
jgi:hypothetical protein